MLGNYLANFLERRGFEFLSIGTQYMSGKFDIRNRDLLAKLLDEVKPNIVINAVANVNLQACEENLAECLMLNSSPSAVLSELARDKGFKYVYISTDHFFNSQDDRLHSEKDTVQLLNNYAKSKFAGECLTLSNLEAIAVRTNLIGLRKNSSRNTYVEWLVQSLKSSEKFEVYKDVHFSPIYCADFVRALWELIKIDYCGLINLASKTSITKSDFAHILAENIGQPTHNMKITKSLCGNLLRPKSMGLDCSLFETITGFNLPTPSQTIKSLTRSESF